MGGVFTSCVVLAFFDMDSLFKSWLSLRADGLSSLFLYQTLTYLLIPGSVVLFALCALLFFLAGRTLEPVLGRQNFSVLLLAWALLGGLAEIALYPAAIVKGNAPLAVGALCAYAIVLPQACWRTRWFSLPLAPLAVVSAVWIIARTAVDRVTPGMLTPETILAPVAALALVATFTGVYLRSQGLGRPTHIELRIAKARREHLRLQSLPPSAFIEEFVNPILEKISANGMKSLTRRERRILKISRDKLVKADSREKSGNRSPADAKQDAAQSSRRQ